MGPLVPDSFQNKRLIEVTESFLPNLPELKHHLGRCGSNSRLRAGNDLKNPQDHMQKHVPLQV